MRAEAGAGANSTKPSNTNAATLSIALSSPPGSVARMERSAMRDRCPGLRRCAPPSGLRTALDGRDIPLHRHIHDRLGAGRDHAIEEMAVDRVEAERRDRRGD